MKKRTSECAGASRRRGDRPNYVLQDSEKRAGVPQGSMTESTGSLQDECFDDIRVDFVG
jgi:hypothetical protein